MQRTILALICALTLAGATTGTRVAPDALPDQGPTSPGPTNPSGPPAKA
jgi:hypothetical protein